MSTTVEESLMKFENWRAAQIPVIATHAQTEGRARFEKLIRIGDAWAILYSGPEGYARINSRLKYGGGPLPAHILAEKKEQAETALLVCAENFLAEFRRLELQSV